MELCFCFYYLYIINHITTKTERKMNWRFELTKTEYGHVTSYPYMAVSNRLRSIIGMAKAEQLIKREVYKKQALFITILTILNLV